MFDQNQQQRTNNIRVMPQTQHTHIALDDIPQSQESEESLLGAILINPTAYAVVATLIHADDFYYLRNGYVWQAITALYSRRDEIDVVTVAVELQMRSQLEHVGGKAYLMQLIAQTPTSVNVEVYARIVQRFSARRQMWAAADEIKALAIDGKLSTTKIADMAYARLEDATSNMRIEGISHIEDDLAEHMDLVEQQQKSPVGLIPTGIRDLDALIGGWAPRKMAVVAGRKHMGKTGFMVTIALNALRLGLHVGFANSADGSKRDVLNNFLGVIAGIEPYKIDTGQMNNDEYKRYVEACGKLSKMKLFIFNKKGMDTGELYMHMNTVKHKYGLDLLIVDYLQRIRPSARAPRYAQNSEREAMNYVSQALTKMIDVDYLNVPLVVGAQINRAGVRGAKAPTLENLKGTGNMEEDADVGILLHRPGAYDAEHEHPDLTEVIIEKNKVTRKLGKVRCRTIRETAQFTPWQ